MNRVQLGKSGLHVSEVCLGTMTFGREADEAAGFAIMDYFVDQGGTFLDTADVYNLGETESIIGRWMKARGNRGNLAIATKVFGKMGEGPNDRGLSRIHIQHAVDESLRRLQTDVIDLYQIHRWDATVPLEETLDALNDVVRAGKVRYIGCSNLRAFQLQRCLDYTRRCGMSSFISLQPAYNAINRAVESELLPLCLDEGIGIIAYNPLAGGMLTGKYRKGGDLPKGSRMDAFQFYHERYYNDQALEIVEHFLQAAAERGVTPAQLALAWVLAEPGISAPILGARSLAQITEALEGVSVKLSSDERAAIPAVQPGRWVGADPVYDQ